jgi:SAM-dependent methyltransferase
MNIITHRVDSYNIEAELKKVKDRLVNDEQKLDLFNQLCEFEYGRWLLVNRGLNSYWSNYMMYHQECDSKLHPLESIMLEKSPGVLASRERSELNNNIIQKMLHNDMTVASIPCGFMNDLLRLDFGHVKNVKLVGVDLDPRAIEYAKENAERFKKDDVCVFHMRDAWMLELENEFDLLTSGGLNMYVKNEPDLISLYANFYKAVKTGGCLIVTSNTPPMDDKGELFWNVSQEEFAQMPMQGLIFGDVVNVRQGVFCTETQIINQLKSVGFKDVTVDYDSRNMFLSFIARK